MPISNSLSKDDEEDIVGLTEEQVLKNQQTFGENKVMPITSKPSWFKFARNALMDRCLLVLLIATIISLSIASYRMYKTHNWHELLEPVGILIAILLVIIINATIDLRRELKFVELQRIISQTTLQCMVKRRRDNHANDSWIKIPIDQVVVGDVVSIRTGDLVPADGSVLQTTELGVDESQQTGESDLVYKRKDDKLLSASKVINGLGIMQVTAVGIHSSHGAILQDVLPYSNQGEQRTLLQLKLDRLANQIAIFGIIISLLLIGVLLIKGIIIQKQNSISDTILHAVMQAVALLVVIVPEGLPMAVTLTLVYGSVNLLRQGCLVRHLAATEIMSSVTCICTDKTGTLTLNQMTCVDYYCPNENEDIVRKAVFSNIDTSKALTATERALIDKVDSMNMMNLNKRDQDQAKVLLRIPFSSTTKYSAVIMEDFDYNNHNSNDSSKRPVLRAYVLGASELLCTKQGNPDFERRAAEMSRQALRTIALAQADISLSQLDAIEQAIIHKTSILNHLNKIKMLAIFGLADPLRPNIQLSIQQCQQAGINVRMLTGDGLPTARTLATKSGILTTGGSALEGWQFRDLVEEQLRNVLPRLQVLARSTPQDKLSLVKALQQHGEVVAVTGDGTNDAPSLKQADLGLVMGHTGTQVAKCAGDIIILNDNFQDIVECIRWGRLIRQGLRRFLEFQLTVNVCAVIISFTTSIMGTKSVLTPLQLLWINLVMDTIASVSLATPSFNKRNVDAILKEPPESPDAPLLTFQIKRNILVQSVVQSLMLLGLYIWWPIRLVLYKSTFIFHGFVMLQLGNQLGIMFGRYNKLWMAIWIGSLCSQFGTILLIPSLFGCVRLPWTLLLASLMALFVPPLNNYLTNKISRCYPHPPLEISSSPPPYQRISMSREQLKWHHTIRQVRTKLQIYQAIRH